MAGKSCAQHKKSRNNFEGNGQPNKNKQMTKKQEAAEKKKKETETNQEIKQKKKASEDLKKKQEGSTYMYVLHG